MKEITTKLFVGNQIDFENLVRQQTGWAVVHACKEPYHREALGYTGRAAPKTHPEYLIARRGDRLILNLVDVENPAYISKEIIDTALTFIQEKLQDGLKVLIHCNQGASRSAGIALLYLAWSGAIHAASFNEAHDAFKQIYPECSLAGGMRGFLQDNWLAYTNAK